MVQLTTPEYYGEFVQELAEMHRLRYRVFKRRLDWNVAFSDDTEVDEFDVLRPVHLLYRSTDGRNHGCVRLLLRSTQPCSVTFSRSLWMGRRRQQATKSGRAAGSALIVLRAHRKRVEVSLAPRTGSSQP